MTEIPTMECPDPMCRDGVYHERQRCHTCDGTGRVDRPPLTSDEIAALPDACGRCGCAEARSGLARCPHGHGELGRLIVAGRRFDEQDSLGVWEAYKLSGRPGLAVIVPKHWGTAAARRLNDLSGYRVWLAEDGAEG